MANKVFALQRIRRMPKKRPLIVLRSKPEDYAPVKSEKRKLDVIMTDHLDPEFDSFAKALEQKE